MKIFQNQTLLVENINAKNSLITEKQLIWKNASYLIYSNFNIKLSKKI